jgi:putative addiction module component (TIGR02574 family)
MSILEQVKELPVPERIKLVEGIWDSIEAETETVELSPEQQAELERRIEDLRLNPGGGIPWETIRAEALARK